MKIKILSVNISVDFLVLLLILNPLFINESIAQTENSIVKRKVHYSFSLPVYRKDHMLGNTYAILYKNSEVVDTVLIDYMPVIINDTTILYIQVNLISTENNDDGLYGNTELGELIYYDNKNFNVINPPLFSTYFSGFNFSDNNIYYFGMDDVLYACRYNIKNKSFKKLKLTDTWPAGDCRIFEAPEFIDDKIVFSVTYDKIVWEVDKGFNTSTKFDYNIDFFGK
jgi:hypothetical protein